MNEGHSEHALSPLVQQRGEAGVLLDLLVQLVKLEESFLVVPPLPLVQDLQLQTSRNDVSAAT